MLVISQLVPWVLAHNLTPIMSTPHVCQCGNGVCCVFRGSWYSGHCDVPRDDIETTEEVVKLQYFGFNTQRVWQTYEVHVLIPGTDREEQTQTNVHQRGFSRGRKKMPVLQRFLLWSLYVQWGRPVATLTVFFWNSWMPRKNDRCYPNSKYLSEDVDT